MFECSYLVHGTTHPLGQIRVDFPHYDDLDQIWQGIPGFDSNLISSNPTVDHAQNLLSLVQTKPVEKHTPPAEVHAQEEGNTNDNGKPQDNEGADFFADDMQVYNDDYVLDGPNDGDEELMAVDANDFPARASHNQVGIKSTVKYHCVAKLTA